MTYPILPNVPNQTPSSSSTSEPAPCENDINNYDAVALVPTPLIILTPNCQIAQEHPWPLHHHATSSLLESAYHHAMSLFKLPSPDAIYVFLLYRSGELDRSRADPENGFILLDSENFSPTTPERNQNIVLEEIIHVLTPQLAALARTSDPFFYYVEGLPKWALDHWRLKSDESRYIPWAGAAIDLNDFPFATRRQDITKENMAYSIGFYAWRAIERATNTETVCTIVREIEKLKAQSLPIEDIRQKADDIFKRYSGKFSGDWLKIAQHTFAKTNNTVVNATLQASGTTLWLSAGIGRAWPTSYLRHGISLGQSMANTNLLRLAYRASLEPKKLWQEKALAWGKPNAEIGLQTNFRNVRETVPFFTLGINAFNYGGRFSLGYASLSMGIEITALWKEPFAIHPSLAAAVFF